MDMVFALMAGMLIGFVMVYLLMRMGVNVRNNYHIQLVFILGHTLAAMLTVFTERFLLSVLYPLGIIIGSGLGLLYQLFKQKSLTTRILLAVGGMSKDKKITRIRELQAKIDMNIASSEEVLELESLMALNAYSAASNEMPMNEEEPVVEEEPANPPDPSNPPPLRY